MNPNPVSWLWLQLWITLEIDYCTDYSDHSMSLWIWDTFLLKMIKKHKSVVDELYVCWHVLTFDVQCVYCSVKVCILVLRARCQMKRLINQQRRWRKFRSIQLFRSFILIAFCRIHFCRYFIGLHVVLQKYCTLWDNFAHILLERKVKPTKDKIDWADLLKLRWTLSGKLRNRNMLLAVWHRYIFASNWLTLSTISVSGIF